MQPKYKLQSVLLFAIVLTGYFTAIGTIVISFLNIADIGPGRGLTQRIDVICDFLYAALVLSIIFAILTPIFWYIGRPSITSKCANIMRYLLAICIFGELVLLIVGYGLSANFISSYDYVPTAYPGPNYSNVDYNSLTELTTYELKVFLFIDLFFDALVLVYWLGHLSFNWFPEEGQNIEDNNSGNQQSQEYYNGYPKGDEGI